MRSLLSSPPRSFARSLALLAIAALAPVLAFTGVTATQAYRRQQDELRREVVADARRLAEAVDRELLAVIDNAEALAALPALDDLADLASFEETARREQRRHPHWLTVILLDPSGRRLVNAANPVRLGPAVDLPSIGPVIQRRRPLVGNIARGPQRFGIPVRAPVIRNGEVRAVVTVVVSPDGIAQRLMNDSLRPDWIGTVIDRAGRVVARSHGASSFIGKPASAAALTARAGASNGLYEGLTLEGVSTVSAFWRSPASDWSVHIGIPRRTFEAPLRRSLLLGASGAGLGLLLSTLFAALMLRELRTRRRETIAAEQSHRMEALGRLTGGVAHDFNNLLMIIQGNAEILNRRARDEAFARPLAAIRAATLRASKLTRELLIFARGGTAERTIVDLNEAVEGFVEALRQAVGAGISIETTLDPAVGAVEVDRVQLELALLNLAVNARDAMDGRGAIRISTRRAGDEVQIAVSDDGPGFAPGIASKVFEPFFSTKPAGVGTGLGLDPGVRLRPPRRRLGQRRRGRRRRRPDPDPAAGGAPRSGRNRRDRAANRASASHRPSGSAPGR